MKIALRENFLFGKTRKNNGCEKYPFFVRQNWNENTEKFTENTDLYMLIVRVHYYETLDKCIHVDGFARRKHKLK